MADFSHLPQELLLQVARCVPHDLPALSLVCRSTRHIAQDVLYRHPEMTLPIKRSVGNGQVSAQAPLCLARTLLERPDLTQKVRGLRLAVGNDCRLLHGNSTFVSTIAKALDKIEALEEDNKPHRYLPIHDEHTQALDGEDTWEYRARRWGTALRNGSDAAWAGVILALVPNLVELAIDLSHKGMIRRSNPYDFERLSESPMAELFGRSKGGFEFDLSMIPGIRNLRRLYWYAGCIEWAWFKLASLEFAHFTDCVHPLPHLRRRMFEEDFAPSALREIRIECNTFVCAEEYLSLLNAPSGLILEEFITPDDFPELGSLTLELRNLGIASIPQTITENRRTGNAVEGGVIQYAILDQHNNGYCEMLLQSLDSLAETLSTLSISIPDDDDPGFLSFVAPLETLVHFKALRTLRIPQELLLGTGYGTADQTWTPRPVTQLLPASLEVLCFQAPTLGLFTWFEELVHHEQSFPDLRSIQLYCRGDRGDSFPVMTFDGHNVWDCLDIPGAKPELFIYHREQDWDPSWEDGTWAGEYDPNMSRVVVFLDDLQDV
jgi:hypothetical protein